MGDTAEENARERFCMATTSVDGITHCPFCLTKLIYSGPMSLQSGTCECRCFKCDKQRYRCGCAEYGVHLFSPTPAARDNAVKIMQVPGVAFTTVQLHLSRVVRRRLERRSRAAIRKRRKPARTE